MRTSRYLAFGVVVSLFAAGSVAASGCGDSGDTASSGAGASSGSAGTAAGGGGAGGGTGTTSTGTNSTGTGLDFDAGTTDSGLDPDSACAAQSAEATLQKKPVDIIVVIDNSGSMTEEIVGVQKNINQNFATIIENSGLDYRVILVSRHGLATSGQSICIEAPLSGIPTGGCASPPSQPVNVPGKFYHYSVEIGSHDAWCKILSTFNIKDEFNLAPNGWSQWLRPDSFKTFVVISDDGTLCSYNGKTYTDSDSVAGGTTVAPIYDTDLLALSPSNFGDMTNRNYKWYSIIGMGANTPPDKPYEPTDPLTISQCPTGVDPGTGYQALSVITEGLRFPLCDTTKYDVVFQAIAAGVISGAKLSCDFAVPDAPPGKTIDLNTVVIQYTPAGMGMPQNYAQVADLNSCAPDSFYIDKDMNGKDIIHLCPDSCTAVQADDAAKINVLYGCDPGMAN